MHFCVHLDPVHTLCTITSHTELVSNVVWPRVSARGKVWHTLQLVVRAHHKSHNWKNPFNTHYLQVFVVLYRVGEIEACLPCNIWIKPLQ